VREDTVRSAAILREARLRAGYSQDELARVSGKDRTVIARYEQGIVAPSLDALVQLLRACGFDIPLELVPYDPGPDETKTAIQMLSPERRRSPEEDRVLDEQRRRLEEARRREEERNRGREERLRRLEERLPRRGEDDPAERRRGSGGEQKGKEGG
jgi:transcriptional regulator with XRE-family HTH domain